MVSLKFLTASALAALPLASAYITGISVPAKGVAGENATVELSTAIYVQNWSDFSIIWGLAPSAFGGIVDEDIYIGQRIQYTLLDPDHSPTGTFKVDVKIPENAPAGEYRVVAAVPYLVGASGLTDIRAFNGTITISTP